MLETAILSAVSVSWSLSKDIYAFVHSAKNAGCDIEDLDHTLNDDRLLLKRYLQFFEAHLEHFNEEEQSHFQATFECLQAILLKRNNTIQCYRRNGKREREIWAVLGSELEADEKKLAAWISGLQSWLTCVPETAKKELTGKTAVMPVTGNDSIPTDFAFSRGPRSIPVASELIGPGSYANVYQVSLGPPPSHVRECKWMTSINRQARN